MEIKEQKFNLNINLPNGIETTKLFDSLFHISLSKLLIEFPNIKNPLLKHVSLDTRYRLQPGLVNIKLTIKNFFLKEYEIYEYLCFGSIKNTTGEELIFNLCFINDK